MAAAWYAEHLKCSGSTDRVPIQIVLLTDDKKNGELAKAEGIICCTVGEYVRGLDNHPTLQDKLSLKDYSSAANRTAIFPAHLTPNEIHEGIKSGKLFQGSFLASRENYLEGFVNVVGIEKSVLLQGHEGLNRAVDGDIVAIELFDKAKWKAPSDMVLQDDQEDPGDVLDQVKLDAVADDTIERTPTGKIVGIIRRKWRQYCGILQVNPIAGSTRHIFVPAERKIPKVRIETRQSELLRMQRIIIAIDQWPRHSRYPQGHFVRALGPLGDKETENEVLLLEHDVPHSKFSKEVLSFLPKLPWCITEEVIRRSIEQETFFEFEIYKSLSFVHLQDVMKRVDLRDIAICSVDPPGCTDIDDALHCRKIESGNFEVGVHIADVSHFIRPGNAMDKEAASRATTLYLVDKRIDMVPELLSSNLCSLRGNEERFAFSCVWQIDKNANILSTKFHKSIIKSKNALTYEEAQLIIDDELQQHDIAESLRNLNKLAKVLRQRRIEKG